MVWSVIELRNNSTVTGGSRLARNWGITELMKIQSKIHRSIDSKLQIDSPVLHRNWFHTTIPCCNAIFM
jgi:hypothetical protein